MIKKQLGWLLLVLFFAVSYGNASISRTLIDFSKYDQIVSSEYTDYTESVVTNIDGQPKLFIGYKDYLLDNWKVELNNSSALMQNRILSYCKTVQSQRFGSTLGVRVHFPGWNNNSYALIKPPFQIKIYDTNGQYANAGNGVMPNVSDLKSISIWVNGRNFKNSISVRLKDRLENIHEYYLGNLYFDGWRKLVYENPDFTENVQAKVLQREPLYPYDVPYLVLESFVIYRPSDVLGGDFVTYIESVQMEYSPYIVDSGANDIQDEEVWQIITKRLQRRENFENSRLAEDLYLFQQEKQRTEETNDNNTGIMTNR